MEYLDIVDKNDNVIWINTRKESYINKTTNRIISVWVFNDNWEILLQKRSKTCSFMPEAWAMSAWGHVSSWETYYEAAKKELYEELWIEAELDFIDKYFEDRLKINWKFNKDDKSHFCFHSVYKTIYNWEFNFLREDNDEVDEIRFFNLDELREFINWNNLIMPSTIYILNKYFLWKN